MLIGITGGIGSGKSVVSRILRVMGYPVYDTDARAKQLMLESAEVREQLIKAFGAATFINGQLNRTYLSDCIFNDATARDTMNAIVHPAVRKDVERWASEQHADRVFIESAILLESELRNVVDAVWLVTAPTDVRVARVMERNACSREEVLRRIASQVSDEERIPHCMVILDNGGSHSLLEQIFNAL